MKKLMALELGVLAVLLVAAIIVCSYLTSPAFSPDYIYTGGNANTPGDSTGESRTEQTEFVPSWKTYPEDRELLAEQYFVYDCTAKSFLTLSGQEDARVYPASITKLFTAYVVMQYLHPDTVYTAGEALDLVAWGSSVAKIEKGDQLTARQLVEAMLLPSGNDASYILAVESGKVIANDPTLSATAAVQVFVNEMNTRAKNLGMTGTNFVNPDGIHDENHYTTFKDLTILGGICLQDNTIMQNASTPKDEIVLHGETIQWKNTNALINPESPYYCPYATGLKTGQTPDAGSCLLASFRKGGQFLLIGVFGCPEENDRFDDTLQLFNQVVLN